MYSYLYSRKPVWQTDRRAHSKLSHSPSFTDKFIDYSSWIIDLLLDVLVCSIALYFYSLFAFWLVFLGSSKYGATRKNIQRYSTPKHPISYIYSPIFKTVRVAKNIWRIINTIASIWIWKYARIFAPGHYLSSKLTVFLELRSRKSALFSTQIMSADKYPSIFPRQMEATVYILHLKHSNQLGVRLQNILGVYRLVSVFLS